MHVNSSEMTVLVTGGAGFIGSNFCNLNQATFKQIVILDNLSMGDLGNLELSNRVVFVRGDAERIEDLNKVTDRVGPVHCVVHLAGTSSEFLFKKGEIAHNYSNSTKAFTTVLEWACENKATERFIYGSSAAIYGDMDKCLKETKVAAPFSHYTALHHFYENSAEFFHNGYQNMIIIGLRFMSVYGANEEAKAEYANLVSQFIWDIGRERQPVIYGDGTQTRDFIHVNDAVDAITKAIETPLDNKKCHIFNIGTGQSTSLLDIVKYIKEAFKNQGRTKANIEPILYILPPKEINYIRKQQGSIQKTLNSINFKFSISVENGIAGLVQRFDENKASIRRSSSDKYNSETEKEKRNLPDPLEPGEYKCKYSPTDKFNSRWASHPDVIEAIKKFDYSAITPKVSEFIPTLNCPFKCPYCHFMEHKKKHGVWNSWPKNPPEDVEMPRSKALMYVNKLIKSNCYALHFTGGGEPTMYPYLYEVAEHCYNLGGELSISTNGTFKGDIQPEQLIDLNFKRVRISLDTIEKHHEFHGYKKVDAYIDDVKRNIKRLIRAKKAVNADTEIIICIVFNKMNFTEIPILGEEICKFGGVDQVIIRPTQEYFEKIGAPVSVEIQKEAKFLIEEKLEPLLKKHNIELIAPDYRMNIQKKEFSECKAYGLIGGLWPDGTMYMCTETNGLEEFCIGSLNELELKEIYKSPKCQKVRENVRKNDFEKCPITARPFTLNNLFKKIDKMRTEKDSEKLFKWLDDLLALYDKPNPWIQI
ncbi:NAD-dependent epimerase/dehydratase family protein [candidate division KSB1 bacterium]|nr:NAD-dependent epimerase/dehydratase family protein [candidate division KSB1 bacterium]